MIKLPSLFWLIVVATAGFAMFAVKYEVQALADQLARTVKQTDDTERDIRALEAEWAYLNRPDALAQLNQRLSVAGADRDQAVAHQCHRHSDAARAATTATCAGRDRRRRASDRIGAETRRDARSPPIALPLNSAGRRAQPTEPAASASRPRPRDRS